MEPRPRLVPKHPPKEGLTTWLWIGLILMALTLVFVTAIAQAQQAPTGKVIQCVRQGIDAQTGPFNASRCRMVFQIPAGADAVVARRKDNGATLARVDGAPGTQAQLVVPIALSLPAAGSEVRGEIVALDTIPGDDPNVILPDNAAPVQETVSGEFVVPAITPAEFIRALIELGGGQ